MDELKNKRKRLFQSISWKLSQKSLGVIQNRAFRIGRFQGRGEEVSNTDMLRLGLPTDPNILETIGIVNWLSVVNHYV